jgi:acetyltransferase/esterase
VARHSPIVRLVVCHEPPAVSLLPELESSTWRAFFAEVYETYRRDGIQRGMQKFSAAVLNEREAQRLRERPTTSSTEEVKSRNLTYWYEHELRQHTDVDLDQEALAGLSHQILLVGGRESKDQMPYLPNAILARRFGASVLDLPGGHLGYVIYPVLFARELTDALSQVAMSSGIK